ncbi:AlpA family phage regulatory protein [Proteus terrae]|uniref:helix-turn-helix transcriptional regulator n=1 Tax=Proteus TaxID=583 RepID=UPI0020341057|nr:AlpA family phage regulatory protein [Proteus sp. FZP2095]MCM2366510.1 AlpA family transcriptional regulator [Proteus sp. FZP2095]
MNIKLPIKPIRMPDVLKKTGLSRSTIRTLEKKGDFPKRMYLSVRCVAWEAEEVDEWLEKRSQSRETPKCYTERKRNEAGQFVSNA